MDLVLCHTTADFDTLGAAIGLTRLEPGTRIVLAGGAHPAVRDFLALHRDEYALIERRSVNSDQIRSLTVVDTRSRDRLGKVAEWLDLPGVEISVYDHHIGATGEIPVDATGEIPATYRQVEAVGATTTLIVEKLQAGGVIPTPVEATAMALGIHVDTGSLTFSHSTARDARALAWLMEQGANLRAIAEYVDPALSPNLQELLSLALDTMQTETLYGYQVAWVILKLDSFTPGLSSVASRLMELTEIDALLLAAQFCRGAVCRDDPAGEDNILTVIGRSQIEGTDLTGIFQSIGGGGHARAAAASLRDVNSQETLAQLVAQLKAQIPHPPTARELMSSPVRTIRPETTIDEAQRILLRYGHSGLSVVDATGQLVGVISRRDLDIALHHGFSHAPVKGYMATNLRTITPETALPEIESLMVTYDVGRLPVLAGDQLIGIVTRTDVLRQLHKAGLGQQEFGIESRQRSHGPHLLPIRNPNFLLEALRQCLIPEQWQILMTAAQQAEQRGWHLYLVGGAVRDLLLALMANQNTPLEKFLIQDIDLVVDGFHQAADVGAGVELARSLQNFYAEARLEVHGKFQTAALLWHHDVILNSLWIDIATARTEFYPYPAANPEVEASSIRQDLYRRDFTINALAIRLTRPAAGEVLDFFGGLLDLQARQIRVLHANSLIEDPTRIYRAVRFAVRLGFQIDAQTEGYIRHAIASGIYDQIQDRREANQRVSAPALQTRLRAELKYILASPYWQPALKQLAGLGALQCIHATLQMNKTLWRQLQYAERWRQRREKFGQSQIRNELSQTTLPDWLLLLEVLLAHLAPGDRGSVAENLQLPVDSIARLQNLEAAEVQVREVLPECDRPSQVVRLLSQYDALMLLLIALRSERSLRRTVWRYLTEWTAIKPLLDGNALKALGYKPGPQFKTILAALSEATLDGNITTQSQAEKFLHHYFPREAL